MPRKLKIQNRNVGNGLSGMEFEMRQGHMMVDEESDYKEPDTWTIITALNRVLDQSRDSELTDEFWESVKNPLAFLRGELGLTDIQIVVLAMMIEAGEPLSWKKMGNYLNVSRLMMMTYSEEIEEMVKKRWFARSASFEMGRHYEGFSLVYGVVTALRHNKPFVPEKIDGLTEQQFVDKLESRIDKNFNDRNVSFRDDEEWMVQLCEANPHLPLCHEVLKFSDDIHVQSLLLMIVYDYAQWEGTDGEGLTFETINDLYPEEFECDFMREHLRDGDHPLMQCGYIEQKCADGMADTEQYMLTTRAKNELLAAYKPSHKKCKRMQQRMGSRFLKDYKTIKEKPLFYNESEQQQIERLTSLLSAENFPSIQKRLEEEGLRKGFACLFYGGPGTGKTETVLQIARQTGRNLMQVDIADKFVGESEKNIKAVFQRYRELCRNSEVKPILFFNEADGILGKRSTFGGTNPSIEKMDNAMQNIILQEIEDLEGILIATTNLTDNLDSAFERRFIFKIEFHKPNTMVKSLIWRSMLKDLSDEDAQQLAAHFDFSGGQIENIARKRTVDYILSGQYASLEEIEKYCRAELLDNKKERHHIAGFSA